MYWKLNHIKPRLDIKETDNNRAALDKLGYPFRYRHHHERIRHYRMPVLYHLPFFQERFEHQLEQLILQTKKDS